MMQGMKKPLSLSVEDVLIERLKGAAERAGTNVSVIASRAIEQYLVRDAMQQLTGDGYRGLPGEDVEAAWELAERTTEVLAR